MSASASPKKKSPSEKKAKKESAPILQEKTLIEEEKYDSVPYESYVYPQTHPERLYTIAKLFGLQPTDINNCRVLELGCALGGNLVPVALTYPKSTFIGIDISSEQVAQANKFKDDLALKNIEFKQANIAQLDKKLGKFDYIVCHGVFSWVPKQIQDAIFKVCREHLTENGLAVVSYNVLPGWSAVKSLRDMMLYHTKDFTSPEQQIHEAKQLLAFVKNNGPNVDESYKKIIERELKILQSTNDSYVFHEHLENENHQFYLHEFVGMANQNGLSYVSDTEISTMYLGNFNQKVRDTLGAITDIVRQEQYIDFLINRRFRHTILTPAANSKNIKRALKNEQIFDFYVRANYKLDEENINPKGGARFTRLDGVGDFSTNDIQANEILKALSEKKTPIKIKDLLEELKKKPEFKNRENLDEVFRKSGLMLAFQNFLTLHSYMPEFAQEISKKPKAYALARYQAQKGAPRVTSLRMTSHGIDAFSRALLNYLDGTKDMAALAKNLLADVKKGTLHIQKDNKPVTDEKELEKILKTQTEKMLEKLADMALLEK